MTLQMLSYFLLLILIATNFKVKSVQVENTFNYCDSVLCTDIKNVNIFENVDKCTNDLLVEFLHNGLNKKGFLTKHYNIIDKSFELNCSQKEIIFINDINFEIKKYKKQIIITKKIGVNKIEKCKKFDTSFIGGFIDDMNDFIYIILIAISSAISSLFGFKIKNKNFHTDQAIDKFNKKSSLTKNASNSSLRLPQQSWTSSIISPKINSTLSVPGGNWSNSLSLLDGKAIISLPENNLTRSFFIPERNMTFNLPDLNWATLTKKDEKMNINQPNIDNPTVAKNETLALTLHNNESNNEIDITHEKKLACPICGYYFTPGGGFSKHKLSCIKKASTK